jgi:1-acyl-sn-glycerol-3-phosphate acyltransferase
VGLLYDCVAFGMLAYSRAAFRVRTLAPDALRFTPGTLIVTTHRRETDVPVLCPPLYFRARLWRDRKAVRMSFAARDDMFLPGFFAGFPPDLSPRVRRLLYPLGVGRWLPVVEVHPIRSASVAQLGEVLRAEPAAPLERLAPGALAASFRDRAAEAGRPVPVVGGDVLRGDYADLLWTPVTAAEAPGADEFWARRATEAAQDFRALVDVVRGGGALVVFPEGRPSPDGEIGPIRRGLSALVRRGKAAELLPLTLAYDPLVRGRTIVVVAIGPAVPPPEADVEGEVLSLLRRRTALTCGQYVAARLAAGERPTPAGLADEVDAARAEGRPVDPELETSTGRARRLAEALTEAPRRERELAFLAREYESARAER